MVLAYIPTLNGKPQLSSGVERELEYGHDNGKDVYIISDVPDKLSPFLGARCDRVFKTIKEAKKELFK